MSTELMLAIGSLVAGFVFLVKGGDWLVIGASALAKRFGVSDLTIGLTIVAFGTSMPELVISLWANLQGNADICVANVVGSNIANILLILGVAALIRPIIVGKSTVWKEIPFLILASLVFTVMANDWLVWRSAENTISLGDGLILLGMMVLFLLYMSRAKVPPVELEIMPDEKAMAPWMPPFYVIIGIVLLVVGGNWVVGGAVQIARMIGVSDKLIGLTIVAVGTSLPELAASGMAAYRNKTDIAIGNVVGSSIFNILLILGVSSTVRALPVTGGMNLDIGAMLLATFLLFVVMFLGKKEPTRKTEVDRYEGAIFVLLYASYIGWLVYNG
mgnify:CR=1 FL=1